MDNLEHLVDHMNTYFDYFLKCIACYLRMLSLRNKSALHAKKYYQEEVAPQKK